MNPTNICVALDNTTNDEAIYVEGEFDSQDTTIYACDIIKAAGGNAIRLTQVEVKLDGADWPDTLDELKERYA